MLKMTAWVLGVLCLSGCALSPQDLRSDLSAKRVFTVQTGYQMALKRIVDYNEECVTGSFVPKGGDGINEVHNYPDLRTATITRGTATFLPDILQIIELREPSLGKTEVIFFGKFRTDKAAATFERVASGMTTAAKCES